MDIKWTLVFCNNRYNHAGLVSAPLLGPQVVLMSIIRSYNLEELLNCASLHQQETPGSGVFALSSRLGKKYLK